MKYIAVSLVFFLYLPICSAKRVEGALSGNEECAHATTGTHAVADYSRLLKRLRGGEFDRQKRKKEKRDRKSTGRR